MRQSFALVCLLGAGAAFAEPPRVVFAPAGECAGEERELAAGWLPKSGASEPGDLANAAGPIGTALPIPAAPAATHLTPTQVASAGPMAITSPPAPPVFGGPGACDEPGSGCSTGKLVEDPDPGTGCGLPGSPCR